MVCEGIQKLGDEASHVANFRTVYYDFLKESAPLKVSFKETTVYHLVKLYIKCPDCFNLLKLISTLQKETYAGESTDQNFTRDLTFIVDLLLKFLVDGNAEDGKFRMLVLPRKISKPPCKYQPQYDVTHLLQEVSKRLEVVERTQRSSKQLEHTTQLAAS